ncbi:MAG: CRISPR-associated protein Cas5 [Thermoguttaceae bacterium]
MRVLCFRYRGRVGHFMRADMNASALSYPLPPRTSLLGLVGCILGLSKDASPVDLADAQIAVGGAAISRHYHRANVRKRAGLTDVVPLRLTPLRPGETLPEVDGEGVISQVTQEWLLRPDFRIYVASAEGRPWMDELCDRFGGSTVRTYFTPCLGPAWMIAEIEREQIREAERLPDGMHEVATVCPVEAVELPKLERLEGLAVQEVRMPRVVTPERVFSHANYYIEMEGRPLPVRTASAWGFAGLAIVFL